MLSIESVPVFDFDKNNNYSKWGKAITVGNNDLSS